MTDILAWFSLVLLAVASAGILLSRDWRWSLACLGAMYLGVFLLVRLYWPIGMSAVKLVTGWMASATLGMSRLGSSPEPDAKDASLPQSLPFRLLAAALVGVVVATLTPRVREIIPGIGLAETASSLVLIGMGLLHLGITSQPLRVSMGLLTVLAGFEILYASVEGSVLVAGLLAVVNLGLALTGAYFVSAAENEEPA